MRKYKKQVFLRKAFVIMMFLLYVPLLFNHAIYGIRKPESGLCITNHLLFDTATFSQIMQDSDGRIYVETDDLLIKINEDESTSIYHLDSIPLHQFQVTDGIIVLSSEGDVFRYAQDGTFLSKHKGPSEGYLVSTTNYAQRNGKGYETRMNKVFSYVVSYDSENGTNEHIVLWAVRGKIGRVLVLLLHIAIALLGVLCFVTSLLRRWK